MNSPAIGGAWTATRLRLTRLAGVVGVASALAGLGSAPQLRADTGPGLHYFQAGQVAEAFQSWNAAAASGDARAALYVGVLYDTGLGVRQDYGRALEWYRRAAAGGDVTAMFNVGVMYDSGRGAPRDEAAAADWYGQAAAKRFGRAEYNLALMYEAGSGIDRDRDRAAQLYRAAAADGVTAARRRLSELGRHYSELGPHYADAPQSRGQSREEVAMSDFQQAQRVLLTRGASEVAEAAALFRRAAEQGNPMAEYDLGYCYEHGIGVPVDASNAITWYRKAAADADNAAIRTIAEAGARGLEVQVSQQRQVGQALR